MSATFRPGCDTEHQPGIGGWGESTLVGSTLHNGLRVLERLGSTREGPLYRAESPAGLEVALLVLGPESSGHEPSVGSGPTPSLQQRLRRAAQIRHSNVAAVHELGDMPEGPGYVVLECLAGELLSEVLTQRGVLPPSEAVDLFMQAAAGLEAAHQVGVVHANLSPDTILVTRPADAPLVKLVGFALTSSLPPPVAKPTSREVAAEYASPERLAGYIPDERSDVFSLGAVLHHLLVGVPPSFGSESLVPQSMRAAVARALLPIPEHRFQTIAEFAEAVNGVGTVVTAPTRARMRDARLLAAGGVIPLVIGGLWLFASLQGPGPGADGPGPERGVGGQASEMPSEGIETGSARPSTGDEEELEASLLPQPPALAVAPSVDSGDAAERALNDDAQRNPARPPNAVSAEASTPPQPSASLTLEERGHLSARIGLDEAFRHLGEPAHAIEGMSPLFIGLAGGRFPRGADPTRPLVRGVYLDPNGELILLDQQRIRSGREVPPATQTRWRIGNVMVYLHGESRPAVLQNLARRVR